MPVIWESHFISALTARISLLIFLGLTLGNLLLLLDRPIAPPAIDLSSVTLLIIGNYLCVVVLLHLGRSISIMAAARPLVTN